MNTSITQKSAFIVLSRMMETCAAMANSIIVARMLGPEGRGKYALSLTILMLLLTPATLGISEANLYLSSRRKNSVSNLIANSFLLAIASSILWIAVFFIFYKIAIYRLVPSLTPAEIFTVLCILPFVLLFIYLQNILIGTGSIREFVKTNIILSVSPLFFLSFFLFDKKLIASEAIYAYMLSYLASCLYCVWCCIQATGPFHFKPSRSLAMESLKYGIKINAGTVLQVFRDNLETLLVGFFMSTAAIGHYSIAQGLSDRLKLLPRSISYILFAEISGSEGASQYQLAAMVTRNTLWLMAVTIIPLIATGKFIVCFLYGNEFLPAVIPLYVLFFSIIFSSIGLTLGSLALGKGEPQICTYVTAIGFISTIGLDIWLIPVWGLFGAAIANTSGLAVMVCLYFLVFRKHTEIGLAQFLLIQKEDFKYYVLIMDNIKRRVLEFARSMRRQ